MSLIKSISGIRGTIGGKKGENLTPYDIIAFTSAYSAMLIEQFPEEKLTVVIGRDARPSGEMVNGLVRSGLMAMGISVIDLGLSTTPTVEMAVIEYKAHGGIIITASHNPKQWNALKLLNNLGEFISDTEGKKLLEIAESARFEYAEVNALGEYHLDEQAIMRHIEKILELDEVDTEAIRKARFKIVVDAVNSTGGISVPPLLKALGVAEVIELFCSPNGQFPHNPEPLPEHLIELSAAVTRHKAHLGISVDPDVDRLALVCEDGEVFGEEYTLVAVADYILSITPGPAVSNLSSSKALHDIAQKHACSYFASAVGEVNVVEVMKQQNAVIGGEGNGGVIFPKLHYGRDALVGIALFLTHLAKSGKKCSILRSRYPNYFISKNKIELPEDMDVDRLLEQIRDKYHKQPQSTIDGVRIEFDNNWVHLRKSNTEPIIRIYAESDNVTTAEVLAGKIIGDIGDLVKASK